MHQQITYYRPDSSYQLIVDEHELTARLNILTTIDFESAFTSLHHFLKQNMLLMAELLNAAETEDGRPPEIQFSLTGKTATARVLIREFDYITDAGEMVDRITKGLLNSLGLIESA